MLASEIADYEDRTHKKIATHLETYQLQNVEINKLKSTYSSNYYYNKEVKKKSIVLHFTAGYLNGDINTLTKKDYKVSVPFVIARNGKIYQLHDPKYWSYHLGPNSIGGNDKCSSQTIGIEISNIGPLTQNGKQLNAYTGSKYCDLSETVYFQKSTFRGKTYYASFTKSQYQSLKKLLLAICSEYDIPYKFLSEDKRLKTFESATEAQNYSGICTHVNFRKNKYDIGSAFDWNYFKQLHLPQFEMSKENIEKSYQQIDINCLNQFPIASYGFWHNGVHLSGKQGSPLYSIADGQVIYTQISADNHSENGSPNFVLIKYQLDVGDKEITFYTLYMHLKKIEIYTNVKDEKDIGQLPPWLIQKFYKKKGLISNVYSDNCVSLYSDYKGEPSKSELYKLEKGDEFDILEPSKSFGKYEIAKVKYNGKEGWIYNRDNKGKKYCQTFLSLHSWAVDPNQNPKKEIFQDSLSFEQPANVYSGQIVGYFSEGLSHVEILKQGKVIKKKKIQCHLEIFSRQTEHDHKNIYEFLDAKPDHYILLKDPDDTILKPKKERESLIRELQKIPEFKKYSGENQAGNNSSEGTIKKEDLEKFVKDYHIKFRDFVASHISSWQAINERIQSMQYPSIDELACFHLFKSSDKKKILSKNEKLFFYHPIRFIEIISNLLIPEKTTENHIHKPTPAISSTSESKPILTLSVSGPEKAKAYERVLYNANFLSEDNNSQMNMDNEKQSITWTITDKAKNKVIDKFPNHKSPLDYLIPVRVANKTIIVAAYENELSLENSIETKIGYSFTGTVAWAARDLAHTFAVFGNHHFIIVKFTDKKSADIFFIVHKIPYKVQGSVYFFTVAAFKADSGNLEGQFNNEIDIKSAREDIDANLKGFFYDFDFTSHEVAPPTHLKSQQFIEKIVMLASNYIENQISQSIEYTTDNYNCAAWVNALFKKIGISKKIRLEKGEFDGFDWGEEDEFTTLERMFDSQ
ncbi:N-acetylmuramoyl-L-alanine amidase, family 2 domain protein [Candidatus Magnetomorum sp. HK-1]|nr:N-acetylmuramoyl-L-alanine amidase, family 2 domain protein [Candidatus Magnetomorum sp. HK-1]